MIDEHCDEMVHKEVEMIDEHCDEMVHKELHVMVLNGTKK